MLTEIDCLMATFLKGNCTKSLQRCINGSFIVFCSTRRGTEPSFLKGSHCLQSHLQRGKMDTLYILTNYLTMYNLNTYEKTTIYSQQQQKQIKNTFNHYFHNMFF